MGFYNHSVEQVVPEVPEFSQEPEVKVETDTSDVAAEVEVEVLLLVATEVMVVTD